MGRCRSFNSKYIRSGLFWRLETKVKSMFVNNKVVSILTVLLFNNLIFAASETMNLYEIPNSPFQKMKMTYSASYGTCTAHTGVTLIQYELFQKQLTRAFIHPFWAAYVYNHEKYLMQSLSDLEGASLGDFLSTIKDHKFCQEEVIEKTLQKYYDLSPLEGMLNHFKSLLLILDTYRNSCTNEFEDSLFDGGNITYGDYEDRLFSKSKDINKERFLKDFKDKLKDGNYLGIISEVFKNCEEQGLSVQLPPLKNYSLLDIPKSAQKVKKLIEKALLKEQKPVGISFCSHLYNDVNYEGLIFDGQTRIMKRLDCLEHGATIVGVRTYKKQREYLLRDSFNFGEITKIPTYAHYESYITKDGQEGGRWMDADLLVKNIFAFTYFSDR